MKDDGTCTSSEMALNVSSHIPYKTPINKVQKHPFTTWKTPILKVEMSQLLFMYINKNPEAIVPT